MTSIHNNDANPKKWPISIYQKSELIQKQKLNTVQPTSVEGLVLQLQAPDATDQFPLVAGAAGALVEEQKPRLQLRSNYTVRPWDSNSGLARDQDYRGGASVNLNRRCSLVKLPSHSARSRSCLGGSSRVTHRCFTHG